MPEDMPKFPEGLNLGTTPQQADTTRALRDIKINAARQRYFDATSSFAGSFSDMKTPEQRLADAVAALAELRALGVPGYA